MNSFCGHSFTSTWFCVTFLRLIVGDVHGINFVPNRVGDQFNDGELDVLNQGTSSDMDYIRRFEVQAPSYTVFKKNLSHDGSERNCTQYCSNKLHLKTEGKNHSRGHLYSPKIPGHYRRSTGGTIKNDDQIKIQSHSKAPETFLKIQGLLKQQIMRSGSGFGLLQGQSIVTSVNSYPIGPFMRVLLKYGTRAWHSKITLSNLLSDMMDEIFGVRTIIGGISTLNSSKRQGHLVGKNVRRNTENELMENQTVKNEVNSRNSSSISHFLQTNKNRIPDDFFLPHYHHKRDTDKTAVRIIPLPYIVSASTDVVDSIIKPFGLKRKRKTHEKPKQLWSFWSFLVKLLNQNTAVQLNHEYEVSASRARRESDTVEYPPREPHSLPSRRILNESTSVLPPPGPPEQLQGGSTPENLTLNTQNDTEAKSTSPFYKRISGNALSFLHSIFSLLTEPSTYESPQAFIAGKGVPKPPLVFPNDDGHSIVHRLFQCFGTIVDIFMPVLGLIQKYFIVWLILGLGDWYYLLARFSRVSRNILRNVHAIFIYLLLWFTNHLRNDFNLSTTMLNLVDLTAESAMLLYKFI